MKRFLKIIVPVLLSLCIVAGIVWYLFFYDKGLTQDMLLSSARAFQKQGNLTVSSWFYDRAYDQGVDRDAVAIEKAEQFIKHGNFTQAEVTLTNAINNGGSSQVYIALCKTFVLQDKLLDAAELLDRVNNPDIQNELYGLRPQIPTVSHPADQNYNELITVSVNSEPGSKLYVSTNGQYPSVASDAYTDAIALNEGYTTLQAIAVAENGLVSPLATYGYTIVGIIEEFTIADSAMDQAIRSVLNLTDGQIILTSDLWKITEFTVPPEAKDYSTLAYMNHLETLAVDGGNPGQFINIKNAVGIKSLTIQNTALTQEDLETIGTMSSLETLTLDTCSLATTAPLSSLTALKYLNLNNNAIGNISAIEAMPELTELYMQRNALRDLSSLSGCGKLAVLDISYNSVTALDALSALSSLTKLDISHNQITDIAPLNICSLLADLAANNNQISDLSGFTQCSSLERINLSYNELTNIDTLNTFSNLSYLNFSHNQVTDIAAWPKQSNLVTIDGSYNEISDLSGLSGLECLNNILMDYNADIDSVAELADCPVLIQVNVYGTKVSDVSMLTKQSIIVNYNPMEAMNY